MYSENIGSSKEEEVKNGRTQYSNRNGNTIELDEEKEGEEYASLATRALFLLSFKDTDTQNLRYVLNVLGIRTVKEKKSILQVIFRLIREGIVYVPKGLPLLVDIGSQFSTNNDNEMESINLCLLRPYDQIIKELQDDIAKIKEEEVKNVSKNQTMRVTEYREPFRELRMKIEKEKRILVHEIDKEILHILRKEEQPIILFLFPIHRRQ